MKSKPIKKLKKQLPRPSIVYSLNQVFSSETPVPLYCMTHPNTDVKFLVWSDTAQTEIDAFLKLASDAKRRCYNQALPSFKYIPKGLHT